MDEFDELNDAVGREPKRKIRRIAAPMRDAEKRTPLEPSAPAPHFNGLLEERGTEQVKQALAAWSARVGGVPIIDIAHELGVSIALAKTLIKEVSQSIHEDLKENVDLNRQLDLQRIDGLLHTFYLEARAGDTDAAAVTIRALQHRAKLVGIEPLPAPSQNHPTNVLVWIQGQMGSIAKLVDSLPAELPPSAPNGHTFSDP